MSENTIKLEQGVKKPSDIPLENKQRWDRRGREQLETIAMPETLKSIVRAALHTPQAGPYHNEGLFMASHLGLIMEQVDAICDGTFDFASLQMSPHLTEKTREFVTSAVLGQRADMTIYAYLHDIKKPDCMNIEYIGEDGKKTQRIFTMEEWQKVVDDNNHNESAIQTALQQMGVTKIGYRLDEKLTGGDAKEHGQEGCDYIDSLGAEHSDIATFIKDRQLILKGVANHELHFQVFSNARSAKQYKEKLADVFTHEEIDFIYSVCLIDISGSMQKDGTFDFKGFKNMMLARDAYEKIVAFTQNRADAGKPLRENKIGELMNLDPEKLDAKIELIKNPPRTSLTEQEFMSIDAQLPDIISSLKITIPIDEIRTALRSENYKQTLEGMRLGMLMGKIRPLLESK